MNFRRTALNAYLSFRKAALFLPGLFLKISADPSAAGQPSAPRRILVVRTDRMGDMVMTLGALRAVKKKYPAAFLCVMANEKTAPLIEDEILADEVVHPGAGIIPRLRVFRELRRKNFDLAVDLMCDWRLAGALAVYFTRAKTRVGWGVGGRGVFFTRATFVDLTRLNVPSANAEILSLADIEAPVGPPVLLPSEPAIAAAEKFLGDFYPAAGKTLAAVHPGGFYPSQRWRPSGFARVIEYLWNKYGMRSVLIYSKRERSAVERIHAALPLDFPTDIILPAEDIRPDVLSAVISKCAVFFGDNSGPLHIASAVGVPTVSVMGPTSPRWRPSGKKQIILTAGLPCSPCDRAVCDSHECMTAVSDERALSALDDILSRSVFSDGFTSGDSVKGGKI